MNYKLFSLNYSLSAIFIAYLLDLIFGDPQWHWHPTRIIGRSIEKLEVKLNTVNADHKRLRGVVLVILVVGFTISCGWAMLFLAQLIHPVLHMVFEILLIYFALSVKDLAVQSDRVYRSLKAKNLKQARQYLAMIVARDTQNLEEKEIIRATVETVAESIMDGIVGVLFYLFLGGPILAWAYKAINTLDSMVGYRSERFIDFGWAAAKLDGLINFIPARLSAIFIFISSLLWVKNSLRAFTWGLKYLYKGPGYNSELTEAVMAGALGVQLGGLNFYNSTPCAKTLIGDNLKTLEISHIQESIRIIYSSSVLAVVCGLAVL